MRLKSYALFFVLALLPFTGWGQTTVVLTTGSSWTVPANVYSLKVECWGGGGAGGSATGATGFRAAAGGGEVGAYAVVNSLTVTPGASIGYAIGAGGVSSTTNGSVGNGGDTWFSSTSTVLAKGGAGAQSLVCSNANLTSAGGIGTSTGSIGDGVNRGGSGSGGTNPSGSGYSGAGGSSAGAGVDGNDASGSTGGTAPSGGFAGAAGRTSNGNAGNAAGSTNYGAGGGGAWAAASTTPRLGGNGALGRIRITYTVVSCTAPTQSFATDPVTKNVGDAAFTNTFTTNSTSTITYSSNATNVATVDASGLVTIAGSGTATITASQAADATYCAASKTYTLNVNACAAPTAPTAFSATATAPTTATLSWTAGDGAGRAAFLKAGSFTTAVPSASTVYTGNATFGSGTAFDGGFALSVGTGNSVNVTGLTANTVYNAKVFEYNNTQGSACYNTTTPLTGTLTTLSNAPTATAASVPSASGFTANWTAPYGNGGATFTYTLEVATDTGFSNIVSTTTSIASGTTLKAISGLTANTTYYYRVRAVNAGGNSDNSNTITLITLPAAPPTPTTTSNCDTTILSYTGGQSSTYYWQGTSSSSTSTALPATTNYIATTAGTYYVRAFANGQWSTATSVAVTVTKSPAISTQPSSTSVGRGSTATFTVVASNANGYQWQENTGTGWANITNGVANGVTYSGATTATLNIANTTLVMSGYQYRVIVGATSPCTIAAPSNSVTLTVTPVSGSTDYYRSRATGLYGVAGTWESSTDSITWMNATAAPTNAAHSVTIRSTDSVTVATSSRSAAHLYIYGKLTLNLQDLAIEDSSSYDAVIFGTGQLDCGTLNGGSSLSLVTGATVLVKTGGRIITRVSGALVGPGRGTQYFYESGAILEYAGTQAFTNTGIVYFPTSTSSTSPIFLISAFTNSIGGNSGNTTFNGIVEFGTGSSMTWAGTAQKIFRDGIIVRGTLDFNTNTPFIITGTNAVLGGTGIIRLASGTGGGMSIAANAVVQLLNDITINGDTLAVNGTLNTNGHILSGSTRFEQASTGTLVVTDAAGITTSGSTGNIQTTGTRSYSKLATYTFQGSTAQTTGDGLPDSVASLIINNAAGLTLSKATTITSTLSLVNGNITTDSTNLLTLNANATISGASAASYINGPLRRFTAANTAFPFPIGKNGMYAPAAVTPADTTASNYTAEHFNGPQTTPGRTAKDTPTLRYVSANAYYDISRGAGANATVTLSYNESNKVTDLPSLVIAHYTGGKWVSEGGTASGNTTSGTVTSGVVSTFSPFAIGSTSSGQPLPIRLVSFNVQKKESTARLDWTLGTTDGGEVIVVERSADGKAFAEIDRKEVTQNTLLSQSATDYAPLAGTNYYRLRIIGINGEESFSQTLLLSFTGKVTEGITLYPNPARDVLTLEWTNSEAPAQISLHNSAGQLVWTERVASGNALSIPVEKLTPGLYWITLEQAGDVQRQKVQVIR